ncbi:hypothetical protein [Mammaliicoccus sciuri]|nr:hypothetical protein [Mammaliicoccus sciuri]
MFKRTKTGRYRAQGCKISVYRTKTGRYRALIRMNRLIFKKSYF